MGAGPPGKNLEFVGGFCQSKREKRGIQFAFCVALHSCILGHLGGPQLS
jgi:hypothetical protein